MPATITGRPTTRATKDRLDEKLHIVEGVVITIEDPGR